MGYWLYSARPHQWFYDPQTDWLYEIEAHVLCYPCHNNQASRAALHRYDSSQYMYVDAVPLTAYRTMIYRTEKSILITGYSKQKQSLQLPSISLRDKLEALPPGHKWAVANAVISVDAPKFIAESIREGTCVAVSDGSYKDDHGTACWVIENGARTHRIYGPLNSPGHPKDHNAYRSELAGMYGITLIVGSITDVFEIQTGKIEMACNGLSALQKCVEPQLVITASIPHFDIIAAICKDISNSSVIWESCHVKGHQDNYIGPLDQWATLNVEMDWRAKKHWLDTNKDPAIQYKIEGEPWSVWFGEHKLCQNIGEEVEEATVGRRLKAYWSKKHFPDGKFDLIDWEVLEKAMKAAPLGNQRWISKHVLGQCGVDKWMKRWKKSNTSKCPRCVEPIEDTTHVWKCSHAEAQQIWQKGMENLQAWMRKKKTDPQLIKVLSESLTSWRKGKPVNTVESNTPGFNKVLQRQQEIGWGALLEGCPALGWVEV